MDKENIVNLLEMLKWVAAGGAGILAGFVASFALEHWPWFQVFSPLAKRSAVIVLSVALGWAGYAVLTYVPAEALAAAMPWFKVAILSITTLLATQLWHQLVNKGNESKSA